MRRSHGTTIAVVVSLGLVVGSDTAAAGRKSRDEVPNIAVAESRFGHGIVTGAVRPGRFGYEVQTPGGNWLACARSCAETLRVETVDFWENKGGGAGRIDNPAGVFGPLSRGRSF
jgi:hypothetical protein